MKQALGQLKQLQELTEQVEQVRRDKEALAVDVRNQQRVCEEKRRRTDQAHQQRIQTTMRADETQVNIQQAEAEIGRLNVQLNAVRHQKEYDALQHSILSHRADIQKWEDEGLASLQATDELNRDERRLSQEAAAAEQELERIEQRIAEQDSRLALRIEQLARDREALRESIDRGALAAYDRLCGRTRSNPLASVKHRICQGCFTRITKQTENLLMRGHEIVYCHSCGRMLMLDE